MDRYVSLAYDYPVLGVFWTTMWIFLWVLWFFLLFRIIGDVFRDDSMSGWTKTAWLVFVIVLPFLGAFVYILARGRGMGRRETEAVLARQQVMDDYIRETAATAAPAGPSPTDQLAKLSEIRARGHISDSEFQRAKEKILH
jgi:hypothetical protein